MPRRAAVIPQNDNLSTDHMSDVGVVISRLRIERGWSLRDLAERANLSSSHMGRIERGYSQPSFMLVMRLVDSLGVSMTDFANSLEAQSATNSRLVAQLRVIGVPEDDITDIRLLSHEARQALLRHLSVPEAAQS